MTATPPWEPPLDGTESEHLFGMLDRLRATFRWKLDGLDAAHLRATVGASTLTPGGLLKHLALCEDEIFAWKCFGEPPEALAHVPDGADPAGWAFSVADDDTPELLTRRYDEAVARSRCRQAAIAATDCLDAPAALAVGDERPSMRRFVCDLVEEYGRHTGHADLLREAIDGRVGEDPPADWRPAWYASAPGCGSLT